MAANSKVVLSKGAQRAKLAFYMNKRLPELTEYEHP